jgi:hypothetical protein
MGEMADAIGFFDGFQAQRSNGLGKGSAGSRVGGSGMICPACRRIKPSGR